LRARGCVRACEAAFASLTSGNIHRGEIGIADMIKLTGIGHVNLRVADQEASKRFYRDVLGF
jgi:catechol-2,3-dioxygenase